MSRPTRPHAGGKASRPRRQLKIEGVQPLEERQLLAPYLSTNALVATFTAATTPTNPFLGTVQVTQGAALTTSASAFTSVAQLTSSESFGGDMVRIQAGPGGDFGKAVYAVSRGAGSNTAAIDKPGVIYRVDPATGKASVFFDLNTVVGGDASNTFGGDTGLVNWFDITFDPEGYFDGRPSMFVSSVDRVDPNKNIIFRVGSDGSFLGAFVQFTEGAGAGVFTRAPSAILVPPAEQQAYLRGLIAGDASSTGTTGWAALYFNANSFRPGTALASPILPTGVSATGLTFGPQTGLTSTSTSNRTLSANFYNSLVYSAFTNFGDPGGPNSAAAPGLSGVQGINGGLLINGPIIGSYIDPNFTTVDESAAIITPFRRFQDIAFDELGYFSYGASTTVAADGTVTVTPIPPNYVGSVFVADLATGLSVQVTPVDPLPTDNPVNVPIQGSGSVGVQLDANGNLVPITNNGSTTGGNIGGRIVRISPDGVVTNFAEGFNTSGRQDSQSFVDSTLSITFSADGTTLYASDNDGIWQFKSVLSLAGSTSGSLIGLNDLRTLGVPYDGQDSAVAVLDTGVDSLTSAFRGRVATGKNIVTGGFGNDDTVSADLANGHGTLLAGAIAQFVPQATLVPVNAFTANTSNLNGTTSKYLFNSLQWLSKNPYAVDPIRPNKVDRIITTAIGFGTDVSFETEMTAYGLDAYPQIVLALKGSVHRLRRIGNQTIAAAGQFGSPVGSGTTSTTVGDAKGEALPAILNEVISVTGTYPFPYTGTPWSDPSDPVQGTLPRPIAPLLISGGDPTVATGADLAGNAGVVGAGDLLIYADKILASANRTWTTDYAAPAVDVPTFRRSFSGGGSGYLVFQEAGTSLSAGVLTGSYSLVASAIDYWVDLAQSTDGVTADAYLNTPVGTRTLAFGSHKLVDLSAYASADGINSILEWTAVPAEDAANTVEDTIPITLFGLDSYRNYARVDVGNAIAAIEGSIALDYLLHGNYFNIIDVNNDKQITAHEIQTFVDQAPTIGLAEAGAMARLLGGTATYDPGLVQPTLYGEDPDQADALQRRYNFFDYASDGQLDGIITIDQYRSMARTLLPSPDAFVVTDRQRAAGNQFLVDAHAPRNFYQLKRLLPTFVWVPKRLAQRYQSANLLAHVGRGQALSSITPLYTLFDGSSANAKNARNGRNPGKGAGGGESTGGTRGSTISTPTTPTTPVTPTTPTPIAPRPTVQVDSITNSAPVDRQQQIIDAVRNLASSHRGQGGAPAGISAGSDPVDENLAVTTSSDAETQTPQEALMARRAQRMQQREVRKIQYRERAILAYKLGLHEEKSVWDKIKDTMFGWL